MEYYAWEEPGRLVTRTATFTVAGVVPISAGGRDLSPTFPGITDSPTLDDWDPPFPVDLRACGSRTRSTGRQYRTTPKAFIPLETGQRMWGTRYGDGDVAAGRGARRRVAAGCGGAPVEASLPGHSIRSAAGMVVRDVRAAGLDASTGATDFGEYFVYFSFFLVVSALLLTSLFFKLGVEQRLREVGLLRAVGFGPRESVGCSSSKAPCWRPSAACSASSRRFGYAASADARRCAPGGSMQSARRR